MFCLIISPTQGWTSLRRSFVFPRTHHLFTSPHPLSLSYHSSCISLASVIVRHALCETAWCWPFHPCAHPVPSLTYFVLGGHPSQPHPSHLERHPLPATILAGRWPLLVQQGLAMASSHRTLGTSESPTTRYE